MRAGIKRIESLIVLRVAKISSVKEVEFSSYECDMVRDLSRNGVSVTVEGSIPDLLPI